MQAYGRENCYRIATIRYGDNVPLTLIKDKKCVRLSLAYMYC